MKNTKIQCSIDRNGAVIQAGTKVRISRGYCGEGYTFEIESLHFDDYMNEVQVYGHNYGPVRSTEIEVC